MTPIYALNKSGKVTVSKTSFMKKSSIQSQSKMDKFYIGQIKRQLVLERK